VAYDDTDIIPRFFDAMEARDFEEAQILVDTLALILELETELANPTEEEENG